MAQLSSRNMNFLSQAALLSNCPLLHAFQTGCGTRSGKPLRLHLSHHLSKRVHLVIPADFHPGDVVPGAAAKAGDCNFKCTLFKQACSVIVAENGL